VSTRRPGVEDVLAAVLVRPAGERLEFLDRVCGDDPSLRDAVASRLAAHVQTEIIAPASPSDTPAQLAGGADAENSRVGAYRLVREIGRGGMGVVYLAARADDQFQHEVAIKLMRLGRDTSLARQRFHTERQILANLDHPGIARLLDGGVSEDGLPYLVMEKVEGPPIDRYCEERRLSIRERLELFVRVCAAVHYAHQRLVVHRDIKPANILVTASGQPKLLDFGIARLLPSEEETADRTATVVQVFTREYASPEQISGETITTASDVYTLGVLLYRLLTGRHPYDFATRQPHDMARVICEVEPERPSTATQERAPDLETAAAPLPAPFAGASGRDVRTRLRGDVDNIVLMALRKDPARRYTSVEQFADDIERHLKGLPVIARPATFAYRASKFVARNRLAVAAGFLILLSLLGGIAATAWQARAARLEKARSEAIKDFLVDILEYSNPMLNASGKTAQETTLNEVLGGAAARLESGEFANQPELTAELELILGRSYNFQGRYDLADRHYQEYIRVVGRLYGESHHRTHEASAMRAALLFLKGDFAGSEQVYRTVVPRLREEFRAGRVEAATLVEALDNFGCLRRSQGDSREAEALFRETLELAARFPAGSQPVVGTTRSTLASTLADQGRFDEALQTARVAVAEYVERGQTGSPAFGFALNVFGGFLDEKGDHALALARLREAEAIFRRTQAPSSLWLGDNLRNQAVSLYEQGEYAGALEKAAEAQRIYSEGFGTRYDHYPTVLIVRGLSLSKQDRARDGERLLREALRLRTDSLPKDHFWVAIARSALGEGLALQRRYAEAEPLLLESYRSLAVSQGEGNPRTRTALRRIVHFYEGSGRSDAALAYRSRLGPG
jgi:serine/threonine protein kinase